MAMCYVSSYIMILIHFNRDVIVYRDKLSTNIIGIKNSHYRPSLLGILHRPSFHSYLLAACTCMH